MALTIKRITVWRTDVDNRVGALAATLEPLAHAGADLQVVMAYRQPAHENRATIEVAPVSGKNATAAAGAAGLAVSPMPTLLVEGDNRAGLGHAISRAVADAGINLNFLVTQVIGRRFSSVIGFDSDADARKGATIIKKAAARK
jgi:hypothetical protein